jgi:hypothetical protein
MKTPRRLFCPLAHKVFIKLNYHGWLLLLLVGMLGQHLNGTGHLVQRHRWGYRFTGYLYQLQAAPLLALSEVVQVAQQKRRFSLRE